jgi:hypothetical protein
MAESVGSGDFRIAVIQNHGSTEIDTQLSQLNPLYHEFLCDLTYQVSANQLCFTVSTFDHDYQAVYHHSIFAYQCLMLPDNASSSLPWPDIRFPVFARRC